MLDWEGREAPPGTPEANEPDTRAARLLEAKPDPCGRLSREQLTAEIISHNPSASAEFLGGFDEAGLRIYLDRLRALNRARGRETLWIRTPDSPAIVSHERLL
jgi:hypothetical protein